MGGGHLSQHLAAQRRRRLAVRRERTAAGQTAADRHAHGLRRGRPGRTVFCHNVPRGAREGRGGDDRNTQIDVRWATAGDAAARTRLAKELVALQADLIVAHGTPTAAVLLQETRSIPIIFLNVSDPIGSGFVASLCEARQQRHRVHHDGTDIVGQVGRADEGNLRRASPGAPCCSIQRQRHMHITS